MAKSSALSSLGKFFSGGASGVAKKLGGLAVKGVNAYTGGVTRGAARAGTAIGQGIAGLGITGGRTALPTITRGVVNPQQPGAPRSQSTFGSGPGRPASYTRGLGDRDSFSGRGIGSSAGGQYLTGTEYFDRITGDWRKRQANEANVAAYNKAFASANEANEARYKQLLGIADATTGQRAKDITADFTGQQASAMQNLASLGLANTSGASTIRGGFGRKKNAALDRLADQMQQTKLGIIERRTDQIPDLASLVSLGRLGISGLKF